MKSRSEIEAFCNAVIPAMVDHVKSRYGMSKFTLKSRLDFSERRTTNMGGVNSKGVPYISLTLNRYLTESRSFIIEYSHIRKDPEIGSLEKSDWKQIVACLIAHELSHAVQFSRFNQITMTAAALNGDLHKWPGTDLDPHGSCWQEIYRDLRVNWVNNKGYMKLNVKVAPPKPTVPKRKQKRTFTVKEINKNGGRHSLYFRASDGVLVAQLFKVEGFKVQFALPGDKKYQPTQYKSQVEARKALIEPLIGDCR